MKNLISSTNFAQPSIEMGKTISGGEPMKATKRSMFQVLGGTLSLLCAAQLFVACQPNSGGGGAGGGSATNSPVQGTGDTGGGNGLNGKVFEAYSKDITQTPEWVTHIEPIQQHINSVEKLESMDFKDLFAVIAKTKRWYIAPVNLETIEKTTLGVEFIKDPVQQLALQTFGSNAAGRSIWIDESKYKAATNTDYDRAYLQMHEVMVALYLIRFMPADEVCRQLVADPSGCETPEAKSAIGAPEAFRKLSKDDYERIRAMTTWTMQQAPLIKSQKEILAELYRQNFDPRFFGPTQLNQNIPENAEKIISWSDLAGRLTSAQVLGRMPSRCFHAVERTEIKDACRISSQLIKSKNPSQDSGIIKIEFTLPGADGQLANFTLQKIAADRTTVHSNTRPLNVRETAYSTHLGTAIPSGATQLKSGDDFYMVMAYFDQNLELTDIEFKHLRATTNMTQSRSIDYAGFTMSYVSGRIGVPSREQNRTFVLTNTDVDKNGHTLLSEFDRNQDMQLIYEVFQK